MNETYITPDEIRKLNRTLSTREISQVKQILKSYELKRTKK